MREKEYSFTVEGISVNVKKKKIKNMYLRVNREDGGVSVSAPLRMSEETIKRHVMEKMDWIIKSRQEYKEGKVSKRRPEDLNGPEWTERKAVLERRVKELIHKWEPVMQVKSGGVRLRWMTSRWGSCNVKTGRITINLILWNMDPDCLEYVVVHELTHLLEASHSPVFWDYMTRFYPDWPRVRRKMKKM